MTGAGGFIGSHLAERLVREGWEVRALVRYNSRGERGWLSGSEVESEIDFRAGDIRDPFFVRTACEGCDVVFHLAALIGIPYSYVAPQSYLEVNIQGTLNVLEAQRSQPNSLLIHTSTSEVYGSARTVPMTEKHPLQAQSPYAATKVGADQLVASYHAAFGTRAVILRPFNTFGPRQSARAIIPSIIVQLLGGVRTLRLGNLGPTRDLNFVSNTVDGFLAAGAGSVGNAEVVQLGTGREISIGELVNLIAQRMGCVVDIETDSDRVRPEKSEVDRLLADAGKAKALLNWTPRISLEEGIDATVAWIRENMNLYRVDDYAV